MMPPIWFVLLTLYFNGFWMAFISGYGWKKTVFWPIELRRRVKKLVAAHKAEEGKP